MTADRTHDISARQRWFFDQYTRFGPDDLRLARYHIAHAIKITPALDLEKLEESLRQLYLRHDVLRAMFYQNAARTWVSKLSSTTPALTRIATDEDEECFGHKLERDARAPFDLGVGPLFELRAYMRPGNTLVILLRAHHLIVDGTSLLILLRSLLAGTFGLQLPFETRVSSQFDAFVSWQKSFLHSQEGDSALSFWLSELSDLPPPLALPYDVLKPGDSPAPVISIRRLLPAELTQSVRNLAGFLNIAPFRICLATYFVLIHSLSGSTDIPVSMASAARKRLEFAETVGWLTNILVARCCISPDKTFAAFVKEMSEQVDRILHYDGYPLHLIQQELQKLFPNSPSCLDEIDFTAVAPDPRGDFGLGVLLISAPGIQVTFGPYVFETVPISLPYASPHQISFRIIVRPDEIFLYGSFNGSRFSRQKAEAIVGRYERLLIASCLEPKSPVSRIAEM